MGNPENRLQNLFFPLKFWSNLISSNKTFKNFRKLPRKISADGHRAVSLNKSNVIHSKETWSVTKNSCKIKSKKKSKDCSKSNRCSLHIFLNLLPYLLLEQPKQFFLVKMTQLTLQNIFSAYVPNWRSCELFL